MFPIRGLGSVGVITDVDPFDLPVGAWSMGINARFTNGRVERGPVFRRLSALSSPPRFVSALAAASYDDIFVGYKNGRVYKRVGASETNYSITGYSNVDSEGTWSSTTLGGLHYINREDRAPWVLPSGGTAFAAVTGWPASTTAKLIRAYNGALVALNVVKTGVSHARLVKFSDIIADELVQPSTWDHTDPTNNAVELPLTEMRGKITDAAPLGTALVVYSDQQAFLIEADGSDEVYRSRPLSFGKGSISANCSIEVEGKHFVFGPNDLWVHDGNTSTSLAENKIRKHVFATMSSKYSNRCFVSFDANLNEVSFCYVSGDVHITSTGTGCNRAAVFNLTDGSWSFRDLPQVYASATANADTVAAWNTVGTLTWATAGGSWADQDGGVKRAPVYAGEAVAMYGLSNVLYGLDVYGEGSLLTAPVEAAANPKLYLERDGIDLDDVGSELIGYKLCRSIWPQGRIENGAQPIEFAFGSSDHYNVAADFSAYQTWDGKTLDHCDFLSAGRYLSLRIRYNDYRVMKLSGFDLDLDVLGE